ncbi:hypothetical protein AOB46_00680 [Chryseobacterium indologenes]|uniref:Uncharacterized protein n=1 Tax=Chryseobacterium indologenes TaxID=253 RepID=A0A0N0IXU1_CHRID|nr:hypothetical protein AOB46_00680 [Chryseobacterium indologenes]
MQAFHPADCLPVIRVFIPASLQDSQPSCLNLCLPAFLRYGRTATILVCYQSGEPSFLYSCKPAFVHSGSLSCVIACRQSITLAFLLSCNLAILLAGLSAFLNAICPL